MDQQFAVVAEAEVVVCPSAPVECDLAKGGEAVTAEGAVKVVAVAMGGLHENAARKWGPAPEQNMRGEWDVR